MKSNKSLILLIALLFILSVNFAFAMDENTTQTVSEIEDEQLTVNDDYTLTADDSNEDIQNVAEHDVVSVVNDDSKLQAEKIQTIKMQGVTNRLNGGIWYKATFYDSTGGPLQNTLVAFSLNNDFDHGYEVVTDANGVALLKAKISNGNHRLNAINYMTGEVVSDNIKVFNVITGGKSISMYYDDGTTYKVRVFDDNGNPVKAGQKVSFFINNKKKIVKTDKNGYAKLKITTTPGVHVISAVYNDFLVSHNLKVKNPFKVKLGKENSFKKFKLTVKLLGKNKKKKLVKVKFNKKTYKSKTNKKGVAVFNLKSPKTGSYKLWVIYKKFKNDYTYTRSYY